MNYCTYTYLKALANLRLNLKYIIWYSTKRRKLRLKRMSPAQYQAHCYREFNN
ncbi:IS3 family transposase [Butyricimonas faecihominis]|uniref:IS3 family transposase n=1 Tax=Butyricimonas faecihominis TaxID=1472416 RepID=UPI003D724B64